MLNGVFAANVTPFDPSGAILTDAYVAHVRWLGEKGLDGVVPFGTNGEGPSCATDEKIATVRTLVDARPGVKIIPAVMEGNLPDTLRFIAALNELPVDAVMVLPPYYFRPAGEDGLHRFFEAAVSASQHPVMLYHIPKYAEPVPWRSIEELPVWGIKNSAGDRALTERVLAVGKGVLLGTEDDLWGNLRTGAPGMISALSNFAPELMARMYRLARDGDAAEGQALSERLQAIRAKVKQYAAAAVLKRLAGARNGVDMGTVRPPLGTVEANLDVESILSDVR